jgi:hypothetical protein
MTGETLRCRKLVGPEHPDTAPAIAAVTVSETQLPMILT